MPLEDALARCVSRWASEGIAMAPPVPEEEVRRVWEWLGMPVSEDVLRLYSIVGGFLQYELDERDFSCFWPWEHLIWWNDPERGWTVPGQRRPVVGFYDHSIEVATWGFRYEDEGTSSVWSLHGYESDPRPWEPFAPDVETFFRMVADTKDVF